MKKKQDPRDKGHYKYAPKPKEKDSVEVVPGTLKNRKTSNPRIY